MRWLAYRLNLLETSSIFPTFHVSSLQTFKQNDDDSYPSRAFARPPPVVTTDRSREYFISDTQDGPREYGKQYLVRWLGYGPESDLWVAGRELKETETLEKWEQR